SVLLSQLKILSSRDSICSSISLICESKTLLAAYEAKVEKLELEKQKTEEMAAKPLPTRDTFEDFIEPALKFLVNPWNIYKKGDLALKRTVLKLAFTEPLRYNREKGYRTAKTTLPFKALAEILTPKCGLVGPEGLEPPT
ncbi:MAG: hypothetical protein AAFY73_14140, partial [Pseudomonadota bacterium]